MTMSSGCWRGAGGIACTEDAKVRAKAMAINLIIPLLPFSPWGLPPEWETDDLTLGELAEHIGLWGNMTAQRAAGSVTPKGAHLLRARRPTRAWRDVSLKANVREQF